MSENMSIQDFLETPISEWFPWVFVGLIVILIMGLPFLAKLKRSAEELYGDNEVYSPNSIISVNAVVLARRVEKFGNNPNTSVNKIVFGLENGQRAEFAIKSSETFGIILEGDSGVLKYYGKKFIGFSVGEKLETVDEAIKKGLLKCANCGEMVESFPCLHCGSTKNVSPVPVEIEIDSYEMTVCPACGRRQRGDRYRCFNCGQTFINKQIGIPYWCGSCGYEGPYQDNCPECGSSAKVYNH